ncbi:MAG: hypothetical protein ACOZQL_19000 [Myxococcota bacterium]
MSVLSACGAAQGPVDSGMDAGSQNTGGGDAGSGDAGMDAGAGDAGTNDAGTNDAGTSDAGAPCVVAFQRAVRFPASEVGCTSRRFVTLRNFCASAQTVFLGAAAPFAVDGGVAQVPALGALDVELAFTPTSTSAANGQLTGSPARGGGSVALHGEGAASAAASDVFTVGTQYSLNLLAVVSDGPGMLAPQQAIGANLTSFWQYALASGWSLRGAVLVGRNDGGTATWASSVPNAVVGQAGTPTTSCLGRAVGELWRDTSGLLPDAGFMAYCAQNTDEQALAGQRTAWLHGLAALVGSDEPMINALGNFMPGCATDDAELRAITAATGGSALSLCAPDGGASVPSAGEVFALSRPLGGDGGVIVELGGAPVPAIDPQTMQVNWTYDASRNAVVFSRARGPQPGSAVTVRYDAACSH